MALEPGIRKAICDDLIDGMTVREAAEKHECDKNTVLKIRVGIIHLIAKNSDKKIRTKRHKKTRTKTEKGQVQPSRNEAEKNSDKSDEEIEQDLTLAPRPNMVRGHNGKGWIFKGQPEGRPRRGKSAFTMMNDFLCSAYDEERSWADVVMESLARHAMAGSEPHMSMLLTFVTKKFDAENPAAKQSEHSELSTGEGRDPLFDSMSAADLETEIFHLLKARQDGDDVEEGEVVDASA